MSYYGPQIIVSGYIARQPELRYTNQGKAFYHALINDTPVIDRNLEKNNPDRYLGQQIWFEIEASGDHAEKLDTQNWQKGQLVTVEGRLWQKLETWKTKEGKKVTKLKNKIRFPKITEITSKKTSNNENETDWQNQDGNDLDIPF